jgi:hypothetical protein
MGFVCAGCSRARLAFQMLQLLGADGADFTVILGYRLHGRLNQQACQGLFETTLIVLLTAKVGAAWDCQKRLTSRPVW